MGNIETVGHRVTQESDDDDCNSVGDEDSCGGEDDDCGGDDDD